MDIPDTSRNVRIQGFIRVQASSNVHIPYVHCMPMVSALLIEHFTASGRVVEEGKIATLEGCDLGIIMRMDKTSGIRETA
jgi:hypothetical protein